MPNTVRITGKNNGLWKEELCNERKNFGGIARIYIYIYTIAAPAWALSDSTSFNPEQVQVQAANNAVPIGTVIVWTKEEIPEGWLECNGQPVPDSYPDLKALMPVTPNYQGRFLEGSVTPGEVKEAGLPNITGHWDNSFGNWFAYSRSGAIYEGAERYSTQVGRNVGAFTTRSFMFDASKANPVYGKSETVQPPAVTVKYIIKAE